MGLRTGFEVVYFESAPLGWRISGTTSGLQDGVAFVVGYELELDDLWRIRRGYVVARTPSGTTARHLEADGHGHWQVDGVEAGHLAGCVDLDLESSAMTNAFPVRRLGLAVGEGSEAPASYCRLDAGGIDRLHQTYQRREDAAGHQCYDYEAPAFDFTCLLSYDRAGLVLDYPGIAVRAG